MDRIQQQLQSRTAYDRGRSLAEEEITKGSLGYREYGKLDMASADEAANVLWDRFQITLTVIAACITDQDVAAEAEGYNARMAAEFNRRFGQNVVDAVYREVERKRKKRRHNN